MLRIRDLHVRYGAITALSGVGIDVAAGEIVALIGANGAGKSTLMRAITGLVAPASGNIVFNNQDITGLAAHRRVGLGLSLVPEGRMVFADQSVVENLKLGAHCTSLKGAALQSRMDQQFALFPRLGERRQQIAGTLSGGEQQMLAISRALMNEPKLLLLDEPSLGLAPKVCAEIFSTIRRLKETGVTILLVEQMAQQAMSISDSAYVLANGRFILSGSSKELMGKKEIRDAYLGGH
ncbi:MAG: ABC transporter ATP-binding protein [Mesorhizobium amorphae]|nr:MAG: ABC transporter ATP-binding protein [Mesorhizobium amorphae]